MPASLTLLWAVGGHRGQTFHRGATAPRPLKTAPARKSNNHGEYRVDELPWKLRRHKTTANMSVGK